MRKEYWVVSIRDGRYVKHSYYLDGKNIIGTNSHEYILKDIVDNHIEIFRQNFARHGLVEKIKTEVVIE